MKSFPCCGTRTPGWESQCYSIQWILFEKWERVFVSCGSFLYVFTRWHLKDSFTHCSSAAMSSWHIKTFITVKPHGRAGPTSSVCVCVPFHNSSSEQLKCVLVDNVLESVCVCVSQTLITGNVHLCLCALIAN